MMGVRGSHESVRLMDIVMHLQDWLAILLSAFLAHRIYLDNWELRAGYDLAILLAVFVGAWVFSLQGLYRDWRGISVITELRAIAVAWSLVFLALALFATLSKTGAEYSRGWGTIWFTTGLTFLVAFRMTLRYVLHLLRDSGHNLRKIVLVGTPATVENVVDHLESHSWIGFDIRGVFIDSQPVPERLRPMFKGSVDDLGSYVDRFALDQVWIALPLNREDTVREIFHALRHTTVDIRYIPDLFGLRLINQSVSSIAGLSVINMTSSPMVGLNRVLKAFEDRILALMALVLLSPALLLIAIAVKISSPGPALYRQERMGWNGKLFTMYKFRSMPVDAESEGIRWGGAREKQTTRLGALLRRTSLDEFPQFYNVLKGDMSIVGPRPERTVHVEEFKEEIPGYMKKHLVKAGITGWAQVNGWRGDTDLSKRIAHDLYYIENWTLWFDLKIIVLTVFGGMITKQD
jgi:undecaprenyl-phosphate glucose phosphotransferase